MDVETRQAPELSNIRLICVIRHKSFTGIYVLRVLD